MENDFNVALIERYLPIEYVKTQGHCSAQRCTDCLHFMPDNRLCQAVTLCVRYPTFVKALPDSECFDSNGLPLACDLVSVKEDELSPHRLNDDFPKVFHMSKEEVDEFFGSKI